MGSALPWQPSVKRDPTLVDAVYARVRQHVGCNPDIGALAAELHAAEVERREMPPRKVVGVDPADAVARVAALVRGMTSCAVSKKLLGS